MESRERFYEFVFPRDGQEARVLVRAWSADEAEANVRQVLRAEGVSFPGPIVARPTRRSEASSRGARRGPERLSTAR
jgi:hypothetical protein